jgi:hypothetical protein
MAERCSYMYLGLGSRTPKQVVQGLMPVWVAALYSGVIPAGPLSPR